MKYRYHLAFVALVLAVLIPYMVYGQAASLPFQLQWGEAVQGGQVMANDTHIVNKFDAAIASVSGSPANVAAHIASTGTDVHGLGTMAIQPATNYIASTAIRAEIDADVATVAGDLSAHSNAVTAVHGAAAGTRFLTASETILDAQIPAAIARDVELPVNASFTLAGLSTKPFSALDGIPTTRLGYGLTDVASLGANTFTGNQTLDGRSLYLKGLPEVDGLSLSNATGTVMWIVRGVNAQTGSGNVGYDFGFNSRTDAGANIGYPVVIQRSTGYVGIGTSTPQVSCHISGALSLIPQASPPSYAGEGTIYSDTDHNLYYHNGTTWKVITLTP
jgi:hypothetical protein